MAKILLKHTRKERGKGSGQVLHVVSITKGESFYAKKHAGSETLLPEGVYSLAHVKITNGSVQIRAKLDLLLVVKGFHSSCHGCTTILFAREDRLHEGACGLGFRVRYKGDCLKAVSRLRMPKIHAVGGFRNVLVYNDEVAVADGRRSNRGWILNKEMLNGLLYVSPRRRRAPRRKRVA